MSNERLEVFENPNHRQPDDPGALLRFARSAAYAGDRANSYLSMLLLGKPESIPDHAV